MSQIQQICKKNILINENLGIFLALASDNTLHWSVSTFKSLEYGAYLNDI
jgi:hypothetical protein